MAGDQDWFSQNAPQSSGGDWFASNAPKTSAPSLDLSNKQGRGTYNMWDTAGQMHPVPYDLVPTAAHSGYQFDTNPTKTGLTPQQQFFRDLAADPAHKGGMPMTMTPAPGYVEPDESKLPLPMQVVGGVAKGAGTLARPILDMTALGTGQSPQDIDQMLAPKTPAETVAKYGTIGAAVAPAAIAAPVATVGSLVGGTVGGMAGGAIGRAAGLNPQQTQVLADLAGAAGGAVGTVGAPAAAQGVGRLALRGQTPAAAMETALKLPVDMQPAQRAAVAQTALNEELPISKGGLEKLYDAVERIDAAKWGEIDKNPNAPIDPNAVAQYTNRSRDFFSNQVNATQDLNAIDAAKQQWLTEQGARPATPPRPTGVLDAQGNSIMTPGAPAQPAQPMTATQAQITKQNTGTILRKKFGETTAASAEAQKDLVFGLKEEIANQFPELNGLNARESQLLDLQPLLEKAVNRLSNNQAVGISAPILGEAVKAVTGSGKLGIVAGIMKGVLDNPMVKSRLAIAVSKGGRIPFATALDRVGAYSAALGTAAGSNQASSAAPAMAAAQ